MKSRWIFAAMLALAFVAFHSLNAADKAPGKDVKCPVSGKDVNPDATVDFGGGKVYFCCKNCPEAFKKDTAKFTTKANHQLAQTGQLVQKACPISGKDTKEGTEVTVNGVKVSFCCNNCQGKVAKMSADEQLETCFKDVTKSFKTAAK